MPLYTKMTGPLRYTVAGNLTINNGIASGFSSSNYFTIPAPDLSTANNWEFVVKSKISAYTGGYQIFFTGSANHQYVGLDITSSGALFAAIGNSTGNGWQATESKTYWQGTTKTVPLNTDFWAKLMFNDSQYKILYSEDGIHWEETLYFNSTQKVYHDSTNILSFGINRQHNGLALDYGILDLNETYIKVDDRLLFGKSQVRVNVKSGLTKYTKVGNPIINNGILSNCSSTNHLELNTKFSPGNQSWEVFFKAKCTSLSTKGNIISFNKTNTRNFQLGTLTTGKLNLYLSYDGTTSSQYTSTNTINLDEWYYYRLRFTGTQYILDLSQDRTTWTTYITVDSSTVIYQNTYNSIGYNWPSYPECWLGEIDLNESYIKIGNSYFWRGSDYYQNLNNYKIHQDNFSKYYTIVDGKLTWANPNIYLENTEENTDSRIIIDELFNPSTDALKLIFIGYNNENSGPIGGTFTTATTDTWRGFCVAKYYLCYDGFGVYVSGTGYQINTKNIFEIKNNGAYINNMQATGSANINEGATKLHLFLSRTNTTGIPITRTFRGKIYTFKWARNNKLFHHLVPVPKGLLIGNFVVPSNGMFDIVTQTFYGNAGTGEFTIGGIPDDYIIEGGKLIWCNPEISLENNSNWSAYINTGIIPTNNMRFRVIAQLTDTTNTYDGCLFGSRANSSASGKQFEVWHFRTNNQIGSFVYGTGWNGNYTGTAGEKYTFEYDGTTYTVNGTTPSTGVWIGDKNINSTLPIFLYGLNHNGSLESRCFRGKVFDFILWSGSTILQYLVPVPQNMVIGNKTAQSNCMFDLVTQTFFTNQGTGSFTYGKDE